MALTAEALVGGRGDQGLAPAKVSALQGMAGS